MENEYVLTGSLPISVTKGAFKNVMFIIPAGFEVELHLRIQSPSSPPHGQVSLSTTDERANWLAFVSRALSGRDLSAKEERLIPHSHHLPKAPPA